MGDAKFDEAVTAARTPFTELQKTLTQISGSAHLKIKGVLESADKFYMRAPGTLTKAFKAPFPLSCCCGKAGQALDELQTLLDSVATMAQDSLKQINTAVNELKTKLDGLDLSPIETALNS